MTLTGKPTLSWHSALISSTDRYVQAAVNEFFQLCNLEVATWNRVMAQQDRGLL